MAVIYVDVEQRSKYIMLGEQGEKNAVVVKFDISTWLSAFGSGGSAFVDVERPGDATAYTKQIELEGSYAVWSVDDIDNAVAGKGKVQLTYLMPGDDGRSKTATFVTMVDKSLDASGDVPDPYESYLEEAREIRAETTQNAQTAQAAAQAASTKAGEASTSASEAYTSARSAKRSEESAERSASTASEAAEEILSMTATATTLPEGSDATVNYNNGVMAFGIPKGDTGARGAKGDTGETGATPNLSIGTVETLAPDEDATATITGTAEEPVLNLGIPKGDTGEVTMSQLSALLPTDTASGDIASFSDGTDLFPALSVKAQIEPIQSLNGYDKPWSGGNGVNKWDEEWEVGGLNGSNGALWNTTDRTRSKNYIAIEPSTSYYIKYPTSGLAVDYCFYDADKNFISSGNTVNSAITTPTNAHYMKFATYAQYGTTYHNDIAINYPSTVTTYSPYSNICPISGHTECVTEACGKNLFDKATALDGYIDDADGELKSGSPYKSTDYIRVVSGNSYYVVSEQTSSMWGAWYDKNKNYIGSVTRYANAVITAPSNATYVRLTIASNAVGNINTFAVNYPSTDHDYHAHDGQTYTTTLGRTVYGGTLDVASGELVVDRVAVDMGSLNWYANGAITGGVQYAVTISDKKVGETNFICSAYETHTPSAALGYICGRASTSVVTCNATQTNVNDFKTAVSGQTICYELATPQTIQLTPQEVQLLLGTNNVWSDGGSIEVKYRANIGLYVDKKISEVNA